ncbi:AfsR/SARP family transcriptional regulator [Streptomyces sp. NRRL F-5135]|uniref:AfsR/SARP family transcriptional regulator n=1 Tax=Streptomyces sp. NRRL F-5135 TaxID=1463858 RepID=UPI000689C5FF|nr:winged helix-turn-helix domain-containing protein [Streptomyces sp. NRRL F-5135]
MRFQLLGPLTLAEGRETVVLKPSKPTSLLAALLLHPGTVVPTGQLLRVLWDEDPPATARAAPQSCVLRLRRLFGTYGAGGDLIEAVPGGYRMNADADTLDLVRFRALVRGADGTGDVEGELYRLKEALTLWQGPLLANVPYRPSCCTATRCPA